MTSSPTVLADLERLADRFAGIDIKYRRDAALLTGWSGRVRIQLVTSKDARAKYRITKFGDTIEEAAARMIDAVAALDAPAVTL